MCCCAVGTCDQSIARGGRGCYLCDDVARRPQSVYVDRSRALRASDVRDGKHSPVAARRAPGRTKKSARRGPAYVPAARRL